ncbi:tryptophan-rich sensory protein [Roseicella frigidaeris]|uniref:Tryptophan-rich sensory protein n=1 Tax=Roseicella frigidaeris TaxID=2230885 RepID=A0A327M435_9PROT|nr:tryptophan-rich sensory protein [Roseicella frigidaeris]
MGWRPILVAVAAACGVAVLGALATDLGDWYRQLRRPAWQPPDWLFGPVWTLIYGLTAWAGLRAWRAAPDTGARRRLLALYAVNGLLNILWSVLFFTLHRPDWALLEGVFFWASVLAMLVASARHDRLAGWLLSPYLAWVGFALALNGAILRLNPVG